MTQKLLVHPDFPLSFGAMKKSKAGLVPEDLQCAICTTMVMDADADNLAKSLEQRASFKQNVDDQERPN